MTEEIFPLVSEENHKYKGRKNFHGKWFSGKVH